MGRRLVALGAADPQLVVAAAIEFSSHPQLGQDAGTLAGIAPLGVPLSAELSAEVDVVIDFSIPDRGRRDPRNLRAETSRSGRGHHGP